MITVSINLVTYNSKRYIEKCLASLAEQTYQAIEFLIIDNASSDGSPELIQNIISARNFKFPTRLIKNVKNNGFAGGHNQAIKESGGALVVCLNPDVTLAPDFIEKAAEFYQIKNGQRIGSLQPKLLRLNQDLEKTNIIDTTGLTILKNRRIIARGQGEQDKNQFDKEEKIFGVDGAAPVYLREALEEAKILGEYFDEDFFMYKEDVDMAWRLRLFGWEAFYAPQVLAWHARGSGESAATDYLSVIKERRKIGQFAKFLSFRNQRLLQIKNELPGLFLKQLPRWLFKEIGAWTYALLFEKGTGKAVREIFGMMPQAWKKRKLIMARKKASAEEMGKWFE